MRTTSSLAAVFLSACAGHVTMQPFDADAWRKATKPTAVNGVVVFAPRYMLVTYSYTSLLDPKTGKAVGSAADGTCKATIQKQDLQVMPDYKEAYLVSMTGSFLNANKLGVTLANGVLTGVNAESTPQSPALITSLATLLEKGAAVFVLPQQAPPGPETACNAEPKVTSFEQYAPDHS